ncbi:hypothetical protein PG991_013157 [Apiospora marii]|uniref:2EXR domain-containing protein n=1 Tax=Apiospora marii TaxID=335849 RepID=A0ABR1R575_9PEZI
MFPFHPFPRLPLELRQRIWAMAIEPRLVVVAHEDYIGRKRTPPPPLLGACSEARSFLLQHYYTKAFMSSDSAQYHYVDFEVDTIHLDQFELGKYPREQHWIQQLSIMGWNSELIFYKHGLHLEDMTVLKNVTIHDCESLNGDNEWWGAWDNFMEVNYFRDDPVPYSIRILGPRNVDVPEINRHNYLKVERDDRRRRVAANPDEYNEVSDSDDEPDGPDRFRLGWHHVKGCGCRSQQ